MTHEKWHRTRATVLAAIMIAGFASTAMAVDPGLNQPGVAGNVGGVARRSVRG